MNKKFQKNILIFAVIFILIILLLNWLIKSGQASRNKNQTEDFNVYYKELLARCGQEKKVYDCCFNSVAYMASNNLKLAGIGCNPGLKLNAYSCLGSYKWCEMIR
ncbi:MAG: hypothetical protein PHF50_04640 [Patescibacteria group bacterium]|nr:hypothetical protein [Patescibacteria group bacterium]